ncbi:MFS transporter [Flavobacterium sp. GNP001]
MNSSLDTTSKIDTTPIAQQTVYSILFSIAFAHLLNDLLQAVIPATYPILKENFNLTFTQIGLITLAYQLAASILQPLVGLYTDKRPKPFSQIFGMLFTLSGIVCLSYASSFEMIIISVVLVGIGSSIFHPEVFPNLLFSIWWKAWFGTIHFSVGRECRNCHRAFVGRLNCGS